VPVCVVVLRVSRGVTGVRIRMQRVPDVQRIRRGRRGRGACGLSTEDIVREPAEMVGTKLGGEG
jgi:hypothetical protein